MEQRSLLARVDPDLLAHFDNMERDSYGYVQRLRDEEAQRKIINAISYDETSHHVQINPYLGDSLTAKSSFEKHASPELIEFCKYEAQPVTLPLFGPDANMTIQAKLSKDPDMNALLQLGQTIHAQWTYDDVENAKQQKAAAEATLQKFAVS